jgi:diguanylate cyclase (GGDEF)-like protein/PAS domain S-box-containing protein
VLVVSPSPLDRHRLGRRLDRAGLSVTRAVDPWEAEAELARTPAEVVLWADPRSEALARALVAGERPGTGPAMVVVCAPGTPAAEIAGALEAGFADVVPADADPVELVARVRAAGRRAREVRTACAAADAFRDLTEGSRDLLARHAPDGTILYASAAARELLGHLPEDLVGRSATELSHPDERELIRRVHEGDAQGVAAGPVLHRMRRRDGRWAWMETTVRAVRDAAGRVRELRTDSRDVTDRMRSESERAALSRVTSAVASGLDLSAVLALAAREAAALVGAEAGAVVRFHGDEGLVVGAAGTSLRTGDAVPLAPGEVDAVAAAVMLDGRRWGMLLVRGGRSGRLGPGHEARLERFAELVSLAIANAEARARLLAMATSDPLTGLANHRSFHERLGAETARARRSGAPLSLVVIDLDHFKRVNDTFGHPVGDEVLREVADRLREGARREDVIARVGGEEFAWLLPEADLAAATEAAERLRTRIRERPFAGAGRQTASLGVASLGVGEGPPALLARADSALYRAKDGGRDAVAVAAPDGEVTAARPG